MAPQINTITFVESSLTDTLYVEASVVDEITGTFEEYLIDSDDITENREQVVFEELEVQNREVKVSEHDKMCLLKHYT